MSIRFENLELHPEFREIIKETYWNEWSESLKKEFNISEYSEYVLDPHTIYYLALEYSENNETKLIGTIGLSVSDLPDMRHLTPWMSYVYIFPNYRKKGFAHQMIEWYVDFIKIRPLYLWCKHPLENFYSDFGYEIIENRSDIAIMKLC